MRMFILAAMLFLQGCSDTKDITLPFEEAITMPGYGYIQIDLSHSTLADQDDSRLRDYHLFYVGDGKYLSVTVPDAIPRGRVIYAYAPFYKDFELYSISTGYMNFKCERCGRDIISGSVEVYLTNTTGPAWCEETNYTNNKSFNYTDGCKREAPQNNGKGIHNAFMGDIYLTPKVNDIHYSFTNRQRPGHQSAGS
ncbi:hypothetical protein EDF78_110126 [Rahnella sp. BIGb0236]|nr:hypothetical protein EDF78_110126 [Rahnella sp. BIGb0236]